MLQTTTQIQKSWSSGFVNRWHTNTDPRLRNAQDTNDAHSNRVAKLAHMLGWHMKAVRSHREYGESISAAIWHDAPEKLSGDIGYETKRAHPPVREVLSRLNEFYWAQVGFQPISISMGPDKLVAMCDQLDAMLFCKTFAPDLWMRKDWQAHSLLVIKLAEDIRLGDQVYEIINREVDL